MIENFPFSVSNRCVHSRYEFKILLPSSFLSLVSPWDRVKEFPACPNDKKGILIEELGGVIDILKKITHLGYHISRNIYIVRPRILSFSAVLIFSSKEENGFLSWTV